MRGSKHTVIKSRILAVIFVLLNAVSVASPVIKNRADDDKSIISSPFGNAGNAFESEENQTPNSSFINHFSRSSVTVKNHICTENVYCHSLVFPVQKWRGSSITTSTFLPKPGYYIFLFRCTLF